MQRRMRAPGVLLLLALLLAACGGAATTPASAPATDDARAVTMAFAFIPNVQFAPFYVADSKGYYAEEGLDVSFDYNFETDVVQRVAQGDVEFAHGSGLSVMLARQQELPVVMVMTQYQRFPVVFFGKGDIELAQPADLRGQDIGIPGRFGASYYALLALLYASDVEESELNVQEVGFNQFQLVLEDELDIASGYAMNEPVRLREAEGGASVLAVADYFPLVSDGVISNEQLISEEPALVQGFVRATLRGLRDTLDNPDEAFELSLPYIPEADLDNAAFARTVLQESLPFWQGERPGYSDPQMWQESHSFLVDLELLNAPIDYEAGYTNAFVEEVAE